MDEIQQLKRRYESRFDDVSAAIFVVLPPEGRILCVNAEAEELTGYERSELEGMALTDIFRSEDRARIASLFRGSAQLEFRKLFEHNVIVRKRSRRKIIVDLGFRRQSVEGRDVFVFTLQDITDLKETEAQLRSAHAYVRRVVAGVNGVLLVVDEHRTIRMASAAACRLADLSEESLVGAPLARLFPTLEAQMDLGAVGAIADVEARAVGAAGQSIPMLVSCSTLAATDGQGQGAAMSVIAAMDLTERKKAERLIADQQAMLAQASKLSALGEMASAIAHEISNPLQIIIGRCELLEMNADDVEERSRGIALIDHTSQRIARIVRGLSAFSRDGRQDPPERVDLREIVQDTLALCEQRLRSGIELLVVEPMPAPLWVDCRATQISQVLLNLLNNAFDATRGRPGATIEIAALQQGNEVTLSVIDSGPPIHPEVARQIFTPFFTTKPVGQGTGIGLAVSRSLMASHGGSLELDASSPRTRFLLRLPASVAVPEAPQHHDNAA